MIVSAALLAIAAAAGVAATPALDLKITGPATVNNVDDLTLTATLTNTGTESLKLFNDPRTVLSSFDAATFAVKTTAGSSPTFTGAKVKYGFEAALANNDAAAFTVLEPGSSVELKQDLSSVYNYTSTGAGTYSFSPFNKFTYVDAAGAIANVYASVSDVHELELTGSLVSTKRSLGRRTNYGLQRRASFYSCTSARQTSINTALTTTVSYLSAAITYLNGISASTTRWATWFGTYSSSHKSTVLSHYSLISSSNPQTYTYDCTCTDSGVYAYVYPDDFGYIYLCGAFWSAPTTGTDSKAGTVVHESSHFTSNGGTDDYAYGQTACKSLAISSPNSAIFNADTHEYFAENNPALS